jgi:hypothetical protein
MPPPVYCTNCTARIYISDRCSDCGHSSEQDSQLLSCDASSPDAAAAPAGDCPLIVWDESMLLHEEGKLEPHPERPDRLRAVMAQLNSNGLTGRLCKPYALALCVSSWLYVNWLVCVHCFFFTARLLSCSWQW